MPRLVDHEVRQREITDAVRRVIVDGGLAAVTFQSVAAEAGISVRLVQYYFGTKREFLLATHQAVRQDAGARLMQELSVLGRGSDTPRGYFSVPCWHAPTRSTTSGGSDCSRRLPRCRTDRTRNRRRGNPHCPKRVDSAHFRPASTSDQSGRGCAVNGSRPRRRAHSGGCRRARPGDASRLRHSRIGGPVG